MVAGRPRLQIDWDSQPLGKLPDSILAKQLGCSAHSVCDARVSRGIPIYRRARAIDWDAQPLGRETDSDIARRLGVSVPTVREARISRGIERCGSPGNCSGIDWSAQPLGQMPDRVLAEQLGVITQTVRDHRRAMGIPSYREGQAWHAEVRRVYDETDWDSQPLGQEPDVDIARRLGTTIYYVRLARVARGIAGIAPMRRVTERVRPELLADPGLLLEPLDTLAVRYGCSIRTVSRAVRAEERRRKREALTSPLVQCGTCRHYQVSACHCGLTHRAVIAERVRKCERYASTGEALLEPPEEPAACERVRLLLGARR